MWRDSNMRAAQGAFAFEPTNAPHRLVVFVVVLYVVILVVVVVIVISNCFCCFCRGPSAATNILFLLYCLVSLPYSSQPLRPQPAIATKTPYRNEPELLRMNKWGQVNADCAVSESPTQLSW